MDKDLEDAVTSNSALLLSALAIQSNRDEKRFDRNAFGPALQTLISELTKYEPDIFNERDRLYQQCIFSSLEARKQSVSSNTSTTVFSDIINDTIWMAGKLYDHIIANKK